MLMSNLTKILCLIVFAQVLPAGVARAETVKVECSAAPHEGVKDLTFETVWEKPADTDDYVIGQVIDAAYDHAGNICIVDYQQKNLVILDGEGNWIRTIGREGEGPGELQDARKIFLDGNRYGLLQAVPGAIVWFEYDGAPSGKVSIGGKDAGFLAVGHATQCGDNIYGWVNMPRETASGYEHIEQVCRVKATGELGPVLYTPPEGPDSRAGDGVDEGKVYDIWMRRWAGDRNGGVWIAPERDQYVLQYWNSKGELALELTRPYKLVERNEDGRESINTWFERRGWSSSQIRVGNTAPVVWSLRVGDDGYLWVELDQGGRSPDSDMIAVYDVFTPGGQYFKHVRMHGNLAVDARRILDDSTVLVQATDSDGEPTICLLRTTEAVRAD